MVNIFRNAPITLSCLTLVILAFGCCTFSGAVALDGRIEPGDMILEVNGVSFENLSNDSAVKALRESVQKPGYVCILSI